MRKLARFLYPVIRGSYGGKILPYRANVAVTKECHSRCENCTIWQNGKSPDELTLDEFRRIAQAYPHLHWLSLTGGEPTDRKDLSKIVTAFHESHPLYLVNLSTNGLNLRRVLQTVEDTAKVGVPRFIVAVSIDGNSVIHDKLRGVTKGFFHASETLAALLQLEFKLNQESRSPTQIKVFASMTLYRENIEALGPMLEQLRQIRGFDVDRLHLNIAHSSPHLYANTNRKPERFDPTPAIRWLLKHRRVNLSFQEALERTYQRLAIGYSRTGTVPLPCAALRASFHLDERGNVYPCTIWGESLGNVRDHDYSLLRVLENKESQTLQHRAEQRKCPNCWSPCEAYQTIATHPFQSLLQPFFRK